ncbi:hypothetical protein [Streptomyces sp. NRRL F-5123]|uniref:hypothetical protein n=1 Tax=Streptomyces sp. NRRL F-5123 TaxID=1463856 RepID=UPI0004E1D5EB|nr:hypothetical protein [Streptomyces sp. NRRL F-5123]
MRVRLQTNHGEFVLEHDSAPTVGALLRLHGIPLSSVWTYQVQHTDPAGEPGHRRAVFVPATGSAPDPGPPGEILARVSRNIDLPGLVGAASTAARPVPEAVTEWAFPSAEVGAFRRVHAQMTAGECLDFVRRSVLDVLGRWPADKGRRVVVGTSGGGDSNVLVSALMESGFFEPEQVVPVMMLGIPDWDTQLGNAQELCRAHGIELNVVTESETARLSGTKDLQATKEIFTECFPDADLEFLGTWLLRRVLSRYAAERGIGYVAIGANREDLVGEHLARVSRGLLPLPAPFRRIGDVTFCYPIWKVPKKIGDGAYPAFSLENYENRNPSFSPGRSVFYYLAYWIPELLPGMDNTLLDGLSKLADKDAEPIVWDEDLSEFICREGSTAEQRSRWQDFLNRVER